MKFKEYKESKQRILPSDAAMKGLIGPYARGKGYQVGDLPDVYDLEGTKFQGKVLSNDGKHVVVQNGKQKVKFKITSDDNMY